MSLTKVTYAMIESAPINVLDFGAIGDGITDDTAAFQNAINTIAQQNGGVIVIPSGVYNISSTLSITTSNVVLNGEGGDFVHDTGTNVDAATKLVWTGAAGGTMISISSVQGAGNSKINGCGIKNMELTANGLAGKAIFIKSHNNGVFENLALSGGFSVRAFEMTCFVKGIELGDAPDNQGNLLRNISARQLTVGSGPGFWFDGSSNANTSFNQFESLVVQQRYSGGFIFANADNNVCIQLRAFRASGGTNDYAFDFYGPTAGGSVGGSSNLMVDCSYPSTFGCILRGTESGFTTGVKRTTFFPLDNGNGSQVPVAETGSVAQGFMDFGAWFNIGASRLGLGADVAQARDARDAISGESLRVLSNASNQIRIANTAGSADWGLNTTGANLRVAPIIGNYFWVAAPLMISPGSSVTPDVNGQLTFEATNNTTVTVKLKGSDGVVRSATLTLS